VIYNLKTFPQNKRGHQPLLGLDVGTTTLGLSLSDRTWTIANSMLTIERTKFNQDIKQLKAIILQHNVGGLIVGWPLNMDGHIGPKCQSVRDFCGLLLQHIDLPLLQFDERLSTVAVTNVMLTADLSRKKRATLVDKLAAAYILQSALDCLKGNMDPDNRLLDLA